MLPTILYIIQNPRLDDFPQGYGALLYGSEQRYLHIITSLFFPPDIPARPNFTPDSNSKWASVAAWLPMFGMTGVIAFLQSGSKNWLKKLLPFLFLCTMIPVLNSIFQLFVMTYYARWFYMLTLMMSLATVLAIENSRTEWKKAIRTASLITLFIAVGIGLMPNGNEETSEKVMDSVGLEKYPDRFWIYVAIAMFSIALTTLIVRSRHINKNTFYPKAAACLGVVIILYSAYIIGLGRSHSYDVKNFIIPAVIEQEEKIELDDDLQTVRSDFYETMDNIGMFWQIPNIQAFHSIVPGSLYDFYPSVGVTRDVASRPEFKYYGLRSLLSVKYVFDYAYDDDHFENDEGKTRMPGYSYVNTQDGFKIYENKNFIPYGFYFDSYITEEEFERIMEKERPQALVYAMILSREQMEKYSDITGYTEEKYKELYGDAPEHFKSVTDDYTFGSAQLKYACDKLKQDTCSKFEYTDDGFRAEYENKGNDKLMFFSVPYSEGFTAEVNGEPVDVEKVDYGFMAVRVPGHTKSEIVFKYRTPGLDLGIKISLCALAAYVVYMLTVLTVFIVKKVRRSGKSNIRDNWRDI